MSLFLTLLLFLSLLAYSSSSILFVLVFVVSSLIFFLISSYNFPFFSYFSLDSLTFLCDEYGMTLLYMMLFIIFYSSLVYLSNFSDSYHKSFTLMWLLFFMSLSSLLVFTSSSLLYIYIGYEMSLIPIIMIIFLWGSYPERSFAAMAMLVYTLIFSLPLMVLIAYLWNSSYLSLGSSLCMLTYSSSFSSLPVLYSILIFLAFAVKLPIYGLHSWLPLAHVEAPTFGSMILAGLLLKLGGCGLYRVTQLMPGFLNLSSEFLFSILAFGMIFSGVICSVQNDLKRLIAYSSVVHMTSIGLLFTLDSSMACSSALILMVLHGVSSPLMFYMVGQAYNMIGTRQLILLRSLKYFYPVLYLAMIICFYLTVPVPPSLSFLGEVYLFSSLLKVSWVLLLLSGLYLFISIIFNLLWLTVFFGSSVFHSSSEPLVCKMIPLSMSIFGLVSVVMTNSMFL